MKRQRLLLGAVDIGYRIEHYTKFINQTLPDKLSVESFSKYVLPESHYKTSYTYTCPIDKTHPLLLYIYCFFFFIFSLFRYDIFHFFSGETLLTRKLRPLELFIYRLLGKKVIMHFVGADIRSHYYLDWKRENLNAYLNGEPGPKKTEPFQDKLINDARKYAHHIIVSSADLLEIVPEAIFFPVLVDLDQLETVSKASNKINILFSPSSHRTKGSNYVHQVLDKIQKKYGDRINIISPGKAIKDQNKYPLTRYEILKLMGEVHIVIDQMLIGWYGLKTVEALACGCEVICFIDKKFEKHQFPNSPIIAADINSLEQKLMEIIDRSLNNFIIEPNKLSWVQQYHTIENNNTTLINAWLK